MADTEQSIPLPALPEPVYTFDEAGNKVCYEKARLVRARDLEVVRCVLEAVESAVNDGGFGGYRLYAAIRALRFHHE